MRGSGSVIASVGLSSVALATSLRRLRQDVVGVHGVHSIVKSAKIFARISIVFCGMNLANDPGVIRPQQPLRSVQSLYLGSFDIALDCVWRRSALCEIVERDTGSLRARDSAFRRNEFPDTAVGGSGICRHEPHIAG